MIGETIFVTICSGGVVFLLYVLVEFWKEYRSRRPGYRQIANGMKPFVVQLPPGPIFTGASIRPEACRNTPLSPLFPIQIGGKRTFT